ncbi:SoxR reducing system RseC family protein [Pseudomonas fluvialis]|uniref:SoxR reducing system RseC family protein n=1 Tax=Pseudomonas fluvialis TaxID=1793966 RepID=UPI0035B0E46D
MIEERGRVVALEQGAVWVQTLRKSTCSSCSAKATCGQGVLDSLGLGRERGHVRALCRLPVQVGDQVMIGVREEQLLQSAVLVYLLPLLGLFAGALLADGLGWSEPRLIGMALLGAALVWLAVRTYCQRHVDDEQRQPVVLRALLASAETEADC